MKIFAYTEYYAGETVTFIVNELKHLQNTHHLLLGYSVRRNSEKNRLNHMVHIPYRFNIFSTKIKWWLEQSQKYFYLKNFIFSKKLNNTISEFKPNIIHCHFGTDFLKVISNLNKNNKKIPILISFYGFDITERIKNKAVLKQYSKYLALQNVFSIAVSKSLVYNINTYIKPFNKSQLLHSGIDTDFYKRKPYPLNKKDFIFLQVAHFNPKKGHKYTLQAFKKFINENNNYNYKFIIIGFGPLEKDIKNQIIELELTNSVIVKGPITPAEMVEISSQTNCFVHMSITADNGDQEGLPNVILEAMSLELPILSTYHAGIPEIVTNNVNGILCEEKNISQYVEAFHKICTWRICPHNRLKIIEQFSLGHHMTELNNLYNTLNKNNLILIKDKDDASEQVISQKNILLTFDYELFLGENSGSVYNSILKPTEIILNSLKKLNLKNSLFFVDTLYLYRLKNIEHHKAQTDYARIYKQLIEILKNGHFIYAHIHTHWFNADYNSGINRWHLSNLLHYRFHSITKEQQQQSFEFSINFIKELQTQANIFYDIDCYRAGGWCIQPFEDFKPYFLKYGIKYDFSVLKNFSLNDDLSYYNFEDFPQEPIYNFEDDVATAKKDGCFKEFTITSIPLSKNKILKNKLFLKLAHKLNYHYKPSK